MGFLGSEVGLFSGRMLQTSSFDVVFTETDTTWCTFIQNERNWDKRLKTSHNRFLTHDGKNHCRVITARVFEEVKKFSLLVDE